MKDGEAEGQEVVDVVEPKMSKIQFHDKEVDNKGIK